MLWATEALPIAVTALLALALQPIFGLTSLVTGRPPTPGAIFGAAAAIFMAIAVGILDKLGLRPGSRFGRA